MLGDEGWREGMAGRGVAAPGCASLSRPRVLLEPRRPAVFTSARTLVVVLFYSVPKCACLSTCAQHPRRAKCSRFIKRTYIFVLNGRRDRLRGCTHTHSHRILAHSHSLSLSLTHTHTHSAFCTVLLTVMNWRTASSLCVPSSQ